MNLQINLLGETTRVEGKLVLSDHSTFHGQLQGELVGEPRSTIIIGSHGTVNGTIHGDSIIIDGFVRGDVKASSKVIISETGRLVGNVRAPNFSIHFGGYFEGKCQMIKGSPKETSGPTSVLPA